jgi:dCMP deaminase
MIERPKIEVVMLRFAELLADRSTCSRLHVGAVVTDAAMLQVLGIGYNGNARGLPNKCDRPNTKGRCGCVHAEANALLKSPGVVPHKVLFCTSAPCAPCAKLALNAGIARVFFRIPYRGDEGVKLLERGGVQVWQILPEGPFCRPYGAAST